MAEINVTPLVDVMLVLLIIFMVTAPMLTQGVDVNLPQASAKAMRSDEERLVITVDANSRVFVGSSPSSSTAWGAPSRRSSPGGPTVRCISAPTAPSRTGSW